MLAKQRYCTCSKTTDWGSMCRLYIQVSPPTHTPARLNIQACEREHDPALLFISAASEELKIAGMTFTTFDLGGHAQGELVTGARRCHGWVHPVGVAAAEQRDWFSCLQPAECGKTTSPPSMESSFSWIAQTFQDWANRKQNSTWVSPAGRRASRQRLSLTCNANVSVHVTFARH